MYQYAGSHPTIVSAWAYEAAMHCVSCKIRRFGLAPRDGYRELPTDREGNAITPVFAGAESDSAEFCDDCGDMLTDA